MNKSFVTVRNRKTSNRNHTVRVDTMQATKIKDTNQLVAVQKLRTQLAERDQIRKQSNQGVVRHLINFFTTQGAGKTMNGCLQKCLHCGRTGQEKIPVCCKHFQKTSRQSGNGSDEVAGRAGRTRKASHHQTAV